MINDPHNREVTWVRLAAGGFTGGRAANADHPVTRLGTDRIDRHLLGAAIEHHLQMLVLEIGDPVGGDERLDDLDDEHDQ